MTDTLLKPSVEQQLDISTVLVEGTNWINGKWVKARSGETIDVIDPSSQELLFTVARSVAIDVEDAVDAAEAAYPAWRDMSPTKRGELMFKWAALARERRQFELLECMDVGRPWSPGNATADRIEYYAGLADKVTGTTLPTVGQDVMGMTVREPFGVCAVIIPWNGPATLFAAAVAPALAAGNVVVVKAAEDAPLSVLYVAKLAQEAGIPDGVINVVVGYGAEAGAALSSNTRIKRMTFTGSPETGAVIMAACAANLIPLQNELGGKSPHVVFADAPLDLAIPSIVANIIRNSGQGCSVGSRVVVDNSIRAEVVAGLAELCKKITVGAWWEGADMGPLINAKQQKRVLDYIASGKEEGATVVVGGNKVEDEKYANGFFVEMTLFDDVKPSMRIAQEEIFGPVLSVIGFDTEEEALEIANGTKYGLASSVWTNDLGRAVRVARRIDAGRVSVNNPLTTGVIGAHAGGWKKSGFGTTGTPETILEYTQMKTIVFGGKP